MRNPNKYKNKTNPFVCFDLNTIREAVELHTLLQKLFDDLRLLKRGRIKIELNTEARQVTVLRNG